MPLLGGPILGDPIFGSMGVSKEGNPREPRAVANTLLLAATFIVEKGKTHEGSSIEVVRAPWLALFEELRRNPELRYEFASHPRVFEEFIAGAYDRAGWDEVILTPRSGDLGRDVIATKRGFGSVRFLEQTKAYSPGHKVTSDHVRAMLGVAIADSNCSKVLITTTSDFAPGVSGEFDKFMPHRLELKNGQQLLEWLHTIEKLKI